MKKFNSIHIKACMLFLCFTAVITVSAQPTTFDGDKPVTTYSKTYTQAFNPTAGWDAAKFFDQWSMTTVPLFNATNIANGYLAFQWKNSAPVGGRVIYSNETYSTPYTFETKISHVRQTNGNRGGTVIRYVQTFAQDNQLQENGTGGFFNRAGIAFYPKDATNFFIQFSGVENLVATTQTRITVPRVAADATDFLTGINTLKIEDFGSTLYVYMNGFAFARIELTGLTSGIYTSGEVFGADLVSLGTFTGKVVPAIGMISVAQRDAAISLYEATVESNLPAKPSSFNADKPAVFMSPTYSQAFSTAEGWDNTKFYEQWSTVNTDAFTATDITGNSLLFAWSAKRVMASNKVYATPYTVEADIDLTASSTVRSGLILRVDPAANIDHIQEGYRPTKDIFNKVGIALYPNDALTQYTVQFTGPLDLVYDQTKIYVPIPAGYVFKAKNTIKVEDHGTSIYVYLNGNPYIRINLTNLEGSTYTAGIVYDASMNAQGGFNGMIIPAAGKIAFAARGDNAMKLSNVVINEVFTSLTNNKLTEKVYQSGSKIVIDFNSNHNYNTVKILDLQGRCIEVLQAANHVKLISKKDYKAGVYLVKAEGTTQESVTKVIVQ